MIVSKNAHKKQRFAGLYYKYFVYTQNGYAGVLYWKHVLLWPVDKNA